MESIGSCNGGVGSIPGQHVNGQAAEVVHGGTARVPPADEPNQRSHRNAGLDDPSFPFAIRCTRCIGSSVIDHLARRAGRFCLLCSILVSALIK